MNYTSLIQIQSDLKSGKVTCIDLVNYYLERINQYNSELNVFLEVYAEEAMNQAAEVDAKIKAGTAGRLAGMVVGIKDVLAYLRLLTNPDDDPAFIRAVTTPKRGIGQKTLEQLGTYAGERGIGLFEALFETGAESRLNESMLDALRTFGRFINNLEYRAQREPAGALLHELLKAIGYEQWLYEQSDERGAQARWQNVQDFVKWMNDKGEEDKLNLLELTQRVALITMLDRKNEDSKPDAVQLSTLHAAKGLEYPHVFLIGCEESILPSFGEGEGRELTDERLEEERRLMYVGVTRAQRSLNITHCKKRKKGRELVSCFQSRFIKELKLEDDEHLPDDTPKMSPKDRLSALKSMLGK